MWRDFSALKAFIKRSRELFVPTNKTGSCDSVTADLVSDFSSKLHVFGIRVRYMHVLQFLFSLFLLALVVQPAWSAGTATITTQPRDVKAAVEWTPAYLLNTPSASFTPMAITTGCFECG